MGRAGEGLMEIFTLKMGQHFGSGSFLEIKCDLNHKVIVSLFERLVFDLF